MRVTFKNVTLHNFLSFGHAEIDLRNRNYCLVKGINNCPLDNAVSNGAGKSTFISAICWALTGETVQGSIQNVKNLFVDEDSCYVTLDIDVDGDSYTITRIKSPCSDMKIMRNGEDISGKGIKESKAILAQYLPDLTKDLLTGVILLGQGLPNKFTQNTPSGRKEVLERLSKSDFIIEDIKNRISSRQQELNALIGKKDSGLTENAAKKSMLLNSICEYERKLREIEAKSYDEEILSAQSAKHAAETDIPEVESRLSEAESGLDAINSSLIRKGEEKTALISSIMSKYDGESGSLTLLRGKRSVEEANNRSTSADIAKIGDNFDVCPTCGQKMPNSEHLHAEKKRLEEALETHKRKIDELSADIARCEGDKSRELADATATLNSQIASLTEEAGKAKASINEMRASLSKSREELSKCSMRLASLEAEKSNKESRVAELRKDISDAYIGISEMDAAIGQLSKDREELLQHTDTVKKMDTLVKRDFRGFLLSGIIEFIDKQAKEYASDLFGTDQLDFKLNGNDIDIEYCGKDFSALSGGEKQRVDIIIQFAIRKMLSQYLDFNSNILCLDELFDNLDAKATTNVVNLISSKLNDIESVFVISHHADELSIPTDSLLTIVKNADGVSYVE